MEDEEASVAPRWWDDNQQAHFINLEGFGAPAAPVSSRQPPPAPSPSMQQQPIYQGVGGTLFAGGTAVPVLPTQPAYTYVPPLPMPVPVPVTQAAAKEVEDDISDLIALCTAL